MRFKDRKDAGERLSELLLKYKDNPAVIVLGLPRGGVVTAAPIATKLRAPLDIICPRKIGSPFDPELAIGAVTESGDVYLNADIVTSLGVEDAYINQQIVKEREIARARTALFRNKLPPLELESKTVILVDDGIATGATMMAAIHSVRAQGALKVVVAVPVAPPDTYQKITNRVDEMVILDIPHLFFGVGEFYEDFRQTENEEVTKLLKRDI